MSEEPNWDNLLVKAREHFEYWADVLGVGNWYVIFRAENNGDAGGAMSVDWSTNYVHGVITLNKDVTHPEIEFTGDAFSRSVLHECVHLLTFRLKEWGTEEMGGSNKSLIWQGFNSAYEHSVDLVTSIVWRLTERTL